MGRPQAALKHYEPHCLAVISGWEFGGLLGFWPTVTSTVSRLPRPVRQLLAVAAGVWLYNHFSEESYV